jgi:FSR family fosmidomycin resistance protein-like MFS transporter
MNSKKYHKWRVYDISIARFVHDVFSSFLAPLLPLLIDKIGLNYFLAGSLTLYGRLPSLMNPFIGWLADKVIIRYFIIFTPAITAISMSLIGLANNYLELLVLLLIMGFSAAFFHVPAPVLIKNVSGEKRGLGMSFYALAGEFARAMGPLLIVSAVSWWGLEGSWRVMPLGLIASVILYFRLKKLKDFDIKPKLNKRALAEGELKKLISFFLIIVGYILGRGLLRSLLVTFLPTFYTSSGSSLWTGTSMLVMVEVFGAVGTLLAGNYSDKIGRKRTLIIIALAMPVLMFLYNISSGYLSVIFLALGGLFMFGSAPVLLALVHDYKSDRPSFINSIYMTLSFVFGAASTMLVGYLSDIYGLDNLFLYSPLLAIVAIPFAFMMPEFEKNT